MAEDHLKRLRDAAKSHDERKAILAAGVAALDEDLSQPHVLDFGVSRDKIEWMNDLVTQSEIARRCAVTRQSVTYWIKDPSFPVMEQVVGEKVWSWTKVKAWRESKKEKS